MARTGAMIPDAFKDRLPPLALAPRWLTPRNLMLGVLLLGTAALALARVDTAPGVLATAAMLLAAWAPMALPLRRKWVRRMWIAWATSIVLLYIGWRVAYDPLRWRSLDLDWGRYGVELLEPWTSPRQARAYREDLWFFGRWAVKLAMVGLFAGFGLAWRAFHREAKSPAADSAAQLAVIAGAWLALVGCVGAIDAFTRPDQVLMLRGSPWCAYEDARCPDDRHCFTGKCVDGRCADVPPPPERKPEVCQDGPSQLDERGRRCEFCRDLTHPWLRGAAGSFNAAIACLGLLGAVAAARWLGRRARWIERVGAGSVEGWSLAYYTPAWGNLAAMLRLVGGVEPSDLQLTCLLVRNAPGERPPDGGYRDVPANGAVIGRLDSTPWMGGLNATRRGRDGVWRLLRTFVVAFVIAIVLTIAAFVRGFVMGR